MRVAAEERVERGLTAARSVRRDVLEGLAFVYRDEVLRALVYSKILLTYSAGVFFAVYVLFMADELRLGAAAIGAVFATGGVGSLIGASASGWLSKRSGPGRAVVGGQLFFGVFGITIPLAVLFPPIALAMVVLSETLQWMAIIVAQVNELAIRQSAVPDRYLGRVNSVFQFFGRGMTPLGALSGGLLGEYLGLSLTLVIASAGFFISFVFVFASPVRNYAPIVDA
jgi:predicted MFS family arabinose efflux permease